MPAAMKAPQVNIRKFVGGQLETPSWLVETSRHVKLGRDCDGDGGGA
jgi:hypothetical protein